MSIARKTMNNLNKVLIVILLITGIGKVNSMELSPETFGMTESQYEKRLMKSFDEELRRLKEDAWPHEVKQLTSSQKRSVHSVLLGRLYAEEYSKMLNRLAKQDFSKEEDVFSWEDILRRIHQKPLAITMQKRDEKHDVVAVTENGNQKFKQYLSIIFSIK